MSTNDPTEYAFEQQEGPYDERKPPKCARWQCEFSANDDGDWSWPRTADGFAYCSVTCKCLDAGEWCLENVDVVDDVVVTLMKDDERDWR